MVAPPSAMPWPCQLQVVAQPRCLALQRETLGVVTPDLKAPQVETLQSSSMGEVPLLDQDLPR